ncbi:MAG: hypothetical protein IJY06_01230 [Oscillospiraceae bacterium]|nr:hypothetical protein [Oscillospiraceae bacterium]MBQ8011880.1 hypothetical protein [Oscillospiraceae bacterium]MBQ9109979.1 hypothetical protein [Oscillospiraceae bacterium]
MNSGMLKLVFSLVAICGIVTMINIFYKKMHQDYTTETALLSVGSDSELVKGVFIRDEEVVTYSGQGVINYEVPDGGKLGIGSVIANVYSSENQIQIKQRIEKLENTYALLERISNPGTTQTAQPTNISNLLTETYKGFLYDRERSQLSSIQSEREEMAVLLSTYRLVTGKDSGYEERMKSIRSEINSLTLAQEAPLDTIRADRTAYFVSYVDGLEETFTVDSIESLTVDQINDVTDNVLTDSATVGKLIDSYEWVLAAVVDNSEKIYEAGSKVTLKFASTSDTVTGEIIMLNNAAGEENTIIAIKCETMTYDLVQHRTENVELIRGEYKGIMVPRNALHFQTFTEETTDPLTGETVPQSVSYRGVYVLNGEQPEFRKLDVIYEGADYVISSQNAGSGYLLLYDSIITGGIDADGQ